MCESVYLEFVVAVEDVAGSSDLIPNQTGKVARLSAVVDEFGDAMRPLLKENGVPKRVPRVPGARHGQHTAHPGTRDPQDHRTVAHLEARKTGYSRSW